MAAERHGLARSRGVHASARQVEVVHPAPTAPRPSDGIAFPIRPPIVAVAATFLVLLTLNLIAIPILYGSDFYVVHWACQLFVFNDEANIPTLFNFLLLVGNTFLLALATARACGAADPWRRHWAGLAVIFLLLAYDEAGQMHERLIPLGRVLFGGHGVLFFGWIVFGAIFALLVGLAYLRFVWAMPRALGLAMAAAGALHLSGALGIELIESAYAEQHGHSTLTFDLMATVEESLEMIGLMLFGATLLRWLARPDGRVGVHIDAR